MAIGDRYWPAGQVQLPVAWKRLGVRDHDVAQGSGSGDAQPPAEHPWPPRALDDLQRAGLFEVLGRPLLTSWASMYTVTP
jgi:hypothetical protein